MQSEAADDQQEQAAEGCAFDLELPQDENDEPELDQYCKQGAGSDTTSRDRRLSSWWGRSGSGASSQDSAFPVKSEVGSFNAISMETAARFTDRARSSRRLKSAARHSARTLAKYAPDRKPEVSRDAIVLYVSFRPTIGGKGSRSVYLSRITISHGRTAFRSTDMATGAHVLVRCCARLSQYALPTDQCSLLHTRISPTRAPRRDVSTPTIADR